MIDINELRQSLGAVQPEEVAELLDRLELTEKERDALRAKIDAMERQGPVATVRINAINGNPSGNFVPGRRYLHHNDKLYLAPGAQPAPSIPEGWKKELFCIQHAMAMNNWNWESDASNDTKRAAYAAVVRLLAASPEEMSN